MHVVFEHEEDTAGDDSCSTWRTRRDGGGGAGAGAGDVSADDTTACTFCWRQRRRIAFLQVMFEYARAASPPPLTSSSSSSSFFLSLTSYVFALLSLHPLPLPLPLSLSLSLSLFLCCTLSLCVCLFLVPCWWVPPQPARRGDDDGRRGEERLSTTISLF